jgi:hypothetical protein
MSNTLYITVTEFKPVKPFASPTFGYTASDSYARDFVDTWGSLADFYADFPTAEALQSHILSSEPFDDFRIGESGSIYMEFGENVE